MFGIKKLRKTIQDLRDELREKNLKMEFLEGEKTEILFVKKRESSAFHSELARFQDEVIRLNALKTESADNLNTSELVEILKQREGVTTLEVCPDSRAKFDVEGPEIVLRIIN